MDTFLVVRHILWLHMVSEGIGLPTKQYDVVVIIIVNGYFFSPQALFITRVLRKYTLHPYTSLIL